MNQLTLFDVPQTVTDPIVRASDPVTSHKAAAVVAETLTLRQQQCLTVLREHGKEMTSNELAEACCERFCDDMRHHPVQFAKRLSNYRKRADEIKRNPDLCVRLGTERDGGELFRAREGKWDGQ
jgi:hypothetical protein